MEDDRRKACEDPGEGEERRRNCKSNREGAALDVVVEGPVAKAQSDEGAQEAGDSECGDGSVSFDGLHEIHDERHTMREGVLAACVLNVVVDRGAEFFDVEAVVVGVVEDVGAGAHTVADGRVFTEALDGVFVVGAEPALGVPDPRTWADDAHGEVSKCIDDLDAESPIEWEFGV